MREVCYCGRRGDLEDREPVLDAKGGWALRCLECGHVDDIAWLSQEAGLLLWGEAQRRHAGPRPHKKPAA